MWELLILLYVIAAVVLLWLEFYRLIRIDNYSVSAICRIWFVAIQFLFPAILMLGFFLCGFSVNVAYCRVVFDESTLLPGYVTFFVSLVAYFILLAMTSNNSLKHSSAVSAVEESLSFENAARCKITAFVCLLVGAICLFLWSKSYGSIFELIEVANAVRGGWSEVQNSLAMFKHPSRLILVASYIYFALLCSKHIKVISLNTVLFVSSVFLSILFLLANDGRLSMGFYILGLFLVSFYTRTWVFKRKVDARYLLNIVAIIIAAIILMMTMDNITFYIRNGCLPSISDSNSVSFLGELLFDPASDQTVVSLLLEGKLELLFVHDFIYGITAWLPTRFSPSWAERLWAVNTVNVNPMSTGEIPCGLVAQGIYDFGIVGVLLLPLLFGTLLSCVDGILRGKVTNPFSMAAYSFLSLNLIRIVSYAMVYDFVLSLFPLAVALVIYCATGLFFESKKDKRPLSRTRHALRKRVRLRASD